MMKSLHMMVIAGVISGLSVTAMAAFTTSEYGEGGFTDGSSVGDILNNLLGTDGVQQVDLTDLSVLATALINADSFDYSGNASLALFDQNNDGQISEQEFVNILADITTLNNVDTSDNGIYARAYATELADMTAPVTLTQIQTAIDTGNTYAVQTPVVQVTSFAFSGLDSSHSTSLDILDGLGNAMDNGSASVVPSFSATNPSSNDASNQFDLTNNGAITLATGVGIEDLEAGVYTFSVTVEDSNEPSYEESVTTEVSLTVSNERGCIINNGIASSNFQAGADNGTIDGATVTISGSHDENDLLFVRTATSTTDNDTGDVVYTSLTNYSAIDNATYDKSSGELVFNGETSLANWIEIFKLVGYIYDDNGSSGSTRSLIFSLSNNIPYDHPDGADHFYNFIAKDGVDFDDALDEAKSDAKMLFGMRGYLATVTSQAEQDYIEPKINGYGWLGGCDRLENTDIRNRCDVTETEVNNLTQRPFDNTTGASPYSQGEGYWYWVTGPERLDYIMQDTGNCSTGIHNKQKTYPTPSQAGQSTGNTDNKTGSDQSYTNFASCEPNNYLHSTLGENHLHFYSNGTWNDYTYNDSSIQGYLIEYGGMDDDPTIDLTEDKTYTIATEGQYCAYQSG